MISSVINFFVYLFHRPILILQICLALSLGALMVDGSLYQLWNLRAEKVEMQNRIERFRANNLALSGKVRQARRDEEFLEKEAKERLDLLKKDELVFIFGDASQQ